MTEHEQIIGAAIALNDKVYWLPRPYRHHNVLHAIHHHFGEVGEHKQGFMTSTIRYLDRSAALMLAKNNGQLLPDEPVHAGQLFSENLWRDKDPQTPVEQLPLREIAIIRRSNDKKGKCFL